MPYRTLALGENGGPGNLYNANPSVVSPPGTIRTAALYESGGGGTPYGGPSGNIPGGPPPYGGPPGNIPPPVGNPNAGYTLPNVGGAMQRYATSVNRPGYTLPGWAPAALAIPDPRAARVEARQAKVAARNLARAAGGGRGGRGYKPIDWSYSGSTMPPGAGTGGYYPGTSGEAQNRVRQDAAANFQQWAQGKGLSPRQIQESSASILAGGGPVGGGGGGGGGVPAMASELMRQYQGARDKANAANESRYKDVLGGRQDLLMRSLQNLLGSGEQEASDINRDAESRQAAMRQSMVDRGLSNTTVLDTTGEVVNREKTDALGRLNERIRQALLGTDERLSNQLLATMENRTDEGPPDFNMLAQLLAQLGAAGPQGGSQLPPLLQGGGGPIFADASALGFGNPLAGMISPMFGGRLGGGTVIRSNRPKAPRRPAPSKGRGYVPLPAASMPRTGADIPIFV